MTGDDDVIERIEALAQPGDVYPALTRSYGLEYARAIIRWANAAERELAALSEEVRA